jgi:DNA alkylation damage repair protein AlkB
MFIVNYKQMKLLKILHRLNNTNNRYLHLNNTNIIMDDDSTKTASINILPTTITTTAIQKARSIFTEIRTQQQSSTSSTSPEEKRTKTTASTTTTTTKADNIIKIHDFNRISKGLDPFPISDIPDGFKFLPNQLNINEQLQLAERCMNIYSLAEYNNITANNEFVPTTKQELLEELRWTTLGYNYDWTNRIYKRGWITTPIDKELFTLSQQLATANGYEKFIPEAVICNYYHPSQRMGPHRDDAELTMKQPIISISLGLEAIFCIETNPPPLLERPWPTHYETNVFACRVRSGDVMIMGGPSRSALHGCALVRPESFHVSSLHHPTSYQPVISFLQQRRINLNIRQVEGEEEFEKFT